MAMPVKYLSDQVSMYELNIPKWFCLFELGFPRTTFFAIFAHKTQWVLCNERTILRFAPQKICEWKPKFELFIIVVYLQKWLFVLETKYTKINTFENNTTFSSTFFLLRWKRTVLYRELPSLRGGRIKITVSFSLTVHFTSQNLYFVVPISFKPDGVNL